MNHQRLLVWVLRLIAVIELTAVIGVIVFLLVVGVIIVGMVLGGARDQDLTVRRLETVQAFYAAEAGMNMAIRELMVAVDEDADGAIGTISDDSNDGTDPTIGTGRVVVTSSFTDHHTQCCGW